ncbi:MAG: hypothetical protein Q8L60_09085 [Gammaproteobacteria bacterium]|nr:hypothetical protein [Gammaproteobacteria bacterium]MDP2140593.1 hypothetical protein [Gammaproteobacteria bacterium]MDP2347365.1 hypothetical protein [Gammaproteobacteria bacterium]
MTSAVIIVLREVLEAMLLICMLMASSSAMKLTLRWLVPALVAGLGGALAYAVFLESISMSFEGFGQEIINSSLLVATMLLLAAHNFFVIRYLNSPTSIANDSCLLVFVLVGAAALGITREGSEIYLYAYSYGLVAGDETSVLAGGAIGAGIGLSLGTFIYYGLKTLTPRHCLVLSCGIALIIGAGMTSQAALFLAQADILPATEPLWDSSALLRESSLLGELLQAAIGYEASPTLVQISLHLGAVLLSIAAMVLGYFSLAGNRKTA